MSAPIEATPIEVIVAEDNPVQRMYLSRLIETAGFKPIEAADGLAALELIKQSQSEILITDYQMPGLDGVALTKQVRALDIERYVHIILITGTDAKDATIRSEALDAGADDFITKQGDPSDLKARLRTATRLIQHGKQLAEQHRILKDANDRINADLAAAANAQQQLLPDIHANILGARVASTFVPSDVVSGDMFGCFPLNETQLGFYAVDVSGHGIHASLLSVAIGYLITPEFFSKAALHEGKITPAALVADLNARFSQSTNDDYFTMFCGVLDSSSGVLHYCQAGYPSPFFVAPNGTTHAIGDGGFPVGMFPNLEYLDHSMPFDQDGMIVIYSDGASEAENANGTPFGTDRIERLISGQKQPRVDCIPKMLVDALEHWRGHVALEDDLTVIALKRT